MLHTQTHRHCIFGHSQSADQRLYTASCPPTHPIRKGRPVLQLLPFSIELSECGGATIPDQAIQSITSDSQCPPNKKLSTGLLPCSPSQPARQPAAMAAPRGSNEEQHAHILRPKPQRYWQITPAGTEPATPRSSSTDLASSGAPTSPTDDTAEPPPPTRTRSILNLTSSTLFGIYQSPSEHTPDTSQPPTPGWATGALTPASPPTPRDSFDDSNRLAFAPTTGASLQQALALARSPSKGSNSGGRESATKEGSGKSVGGRSRGKSQTLPITIQLRNAVVLLGLGLMHGQLLAYLHTTFQFLPIRTQILQHHHTAYLVFWSVLALIAGLAQPRLDLWWANQAEESILGGRKSPSGPSGSPSSPRLSTVWEVDSRRNSEVAVPDGSASVRSAQAVSAHLSTGSGKSANGNRRWAGVLRVLGGFSGVAMAIVRITHEPLPSKD